MHRLVFGFLALLLMLPLSLLSVAAQGATPAAGPSAFADLGLPELQVTATATEFQGLPDQLEAGRYLLSITAAEDVEFGAGLEFIQPSGVSAEEFINFLAAPPDVTAADVAGDATPLPDEGATPVEGEGGADAPPDFYYESLLAGGVSALTGETAHAVIDLPPGEWVAWGGDPFAPQGPVTFEATGEMPADLPEPEAGTTITMDEYEFNVTEGQLTTGPQAVRIDNVGEQPHFMIVVRGPETMTQEQVEQVLEAERQAEQTGTPPAYDEVGLNPEEDLVFLTFTGTQSPDVTTWVELDLEPGMHALACFVPDVEDGEPHAYHGMVTVVEVGE